MDLTHPLRFRSGDHGLSVGTQSEKQLKYNGLYKSALIGNFPDVINPDTDRNPFQFPAVVKKDSPISWNSSRNPGLYGTWTLYQYGN